MTASLTAARLRKLLKYDPRTGRFTWRVSRGRLVPGATAGWIAHHGYHRINIDEKSYYAARLAVLYMTGSWPRRDVDHINGNTSDNRWSNLRQATRSQNSANMSARGTGLKGVVFYPPTGLLRPRPAKPYCAYIKVNYRSIYLGRFKTAKEAHAAYMTAAKDYVGDFARA
jgi:hypothetical protein